MEHHSFFLSIFFSGEFCKMQYQFVLRISEWASVYYFRISKNENSFRWTSHSFRWATLIFSCKVRTAIHPNFSDSNLFYLSETCHTEYPTFFRTFKNHFFFQSRIANISNRIVRQSEKRKVNHTIGVCSACMLAALLLFVCALRRTILEIFAILWFSYLTFLRFSCTNFRPCLILTRPPIPSYGICCDINVGLWKSNPHNCHRMDVIHLIHFIAISFSISYSCKMDFNCSWINKRQSTLTNECCLHCLHCYQVNMLTRCQNTNWIKY